MSSKTLSKICAIKQFCLPWQPNMLGIFLLRNIVIWQRNICLPILMTTFARTEVIFVDKSNLRNFQMSGDFFCKWDHWLFWLGFLVPVCGVYLSVCCWEVGLLGREIILRWRQKIRLFLVDNSCHGYFQGWYFPDYYLQGNIFSHGSILDTKMGSKSVITVMKKTPLHFQTSFLVNQFCI